MVMIKILKNRKIVSPTFDSKNNKWFKIQAKDVIEIETRHSHNKEFEVCITVDGMNLFDGKQDNLFDSKRELVKGEKVFYKWHTGESIRFDQLNSNYSIANNGNPNMRGVIGICIFENGKLMVIDKYYYTNLDSIGKNLPKAFVE